MSLAIVIYSDRLIENLLPFCSYSALTTATTSLYIWDRLEQTGPSVEDTGLSPLLVQALLTSMCVPLLLNRVNIHMLAILVTKLSIQSLTQCYFDLRMPSNSPAESWPTQIPNAIPVSTAPQTTPNVLSRPSLWSEHTPADHPDKGLPHFLHFW